MLPNMSMHECYRRQLSVGTIKSILEEEQIEDSLMEMFFAFAELQLSYPEVSAKQKNAEVSEKLRKKAYKMYLECRDAKQFLSCVDMFAQSIAFAPAKSEQLRMCYISRSVFLFHFKQYKECQKDIDLVYSLDPKYKPERLTKRTKIVISKHSNEYYEKARNMEITISGSDGLRQCSVLDLPVTDKIKLRYDSQNGKHVVAKELIKPGEVVAVEKAFVMQLDPKFRYTHCWHCMVACWSSVPCDHCTRTVFCSVTCRTDAWEEYHKFECKIIDYLVEIGMSHTALRVVLKTVKEVDDDCDPICTLKSNAEYWDEHYDHKQSCKELKTTNKLNTKYEEVYPLLKWEAKRPDSEKINAMIESCLLVYHLAKYAKFFDGLEEHEWDDLGEDTEVLFVAKLLYIHFFQCSVNDILYCEERVDEEKADVFWTATAVMPLLASFNHRCNPNVFQISMDGCVCLIANSLIQPGEQVFVSNNSLTYNSHSKSERQKLLSLNQFFECKCRPCVENWSPIDQLPSYKDTLGKKSQKKVETILKDFEVISSYYNESDKNFSRDMIIKLSKMIVDLQKLITPPCHELAFLQQVLQRFFYRTGNRVILPEPKD